MAESYREKIAELFASKEQVTPKVAEAAESWAAMSIAVAKTGAKADFAASGGFPLSSEIRSQMKKTKPALTKLLETCVQKAPKLGEFGNEPVRAT